MNQLVIAGISLLVLGALLISPIVEPSWSIIVGIIFQGIGTFFLQKGVARSSKETVQNSEQSVIKEINKFKQELQSAKRKNNPVKEIAEIEDEFNKWADEFEVSKDLKVLELNTKKLEQKKQEELLNKKWNQTYYNIFHILKKFFKANAQHSNSSILTVEFPNFPSKLISREAAHYFCKIHFNNGIFLYISLTITSRNNENSLPIVTFTFDTQDKKIGKPLWAGEFSVGSELELIIHEIEDKLVISKRRNDSKINSNETSYVLPQSERKLEENLKEVVEYLIIKAVSKY